MPDGWTEILLIVHAGATFFMTGIIWFVQVIHYRLFPLIDAGHIPCYIRKNIVWTAEVTAPGMVAEALTGLLLLLHPPPGPDRTLLQLGFACIAALWLSRLLVQVPCFFRLSRGYDETTYRLLMQSNWLCVLLWSIRSAVVAVLLISRA